MCDQLCLFFITATVSTAAAVTVAIIAAYQKWGENWNETGDTVLGRVSLSKKCVCKASIIIFYLESEETIVLCSRLIQSNEIHFPDIFLPN